jgi:cyclic pyranopterin phosphate synthase
VSLDTLRPERFRTLTRRDTHARVLAGIDAVLRAGFNGLKLDSVVNGLRRF